MTPLIPSADVRLFVVDDEGVLFSESRQELYSLNTSAALIWCLVEDRLPAADLVDRYAEILELSRSEAERHVYPTLRRWFALGHVSDPGIPGAPDMSLSAALAFLLTNADLRRRFRASPEAVGGALGVREEDRDAFLALDHDALDRQVEEISEHRERLRGLSQAAVLSLDAKDLLEAAASSAWCPETAVRRYRLVDTTFRVTMSRQVEAVVHPVLAHLEADSGAADLGLHVRESGQSYVIFEGLIPVTLCDSIVNLMPSLMLQLRRIAVASHDCFIEVHAGVIGFGQGAVLLPGSAGRGKSTLTAALATSGGLYFSDEIALLEQGTLDVRPMPMTMTIKPGSVEPLRHLYPALQTLDTHIREDGQPVRYLPPPEGHCPSARDLRPARWVVFPHYESDGETVLEPVKSSVGLQRLLDEALVLPGLLDRRKVEQLVGWARRVAFYDLRVSSLDDAVRAVRTLTGA
jgi:hypothetical protein